MDKLSYNTVNWQDESESHDTPLEAKNLKQMDNQIAANVDAINSFADSINDVSQSNSFNRTDITNIQNQLNNLSFVTCTRAEYNAMEKHPATTVYIFIG